VIILLGAVSAIAAIVIVIAWGVVLALAAIALAVGVVIAFGAAGHLRRRWRCDPCHGTPGKCTCKTKARCPHPLCGAADTRVSSEQFSRELRALLDREGGGRG
jgi:hypothetical protein